MPPDTAPPSDSRGGFSRRDFLAGALLTGTLSAVGTLLTPGGRTPSPVTINFVTGSEPSGALDLLVRMWNEANPRATVNVVFAGAEYTRDQRDAMIGKFDEKRADVFNLDIIHIPYFARYGYLVPVEVPDAKQFLPATLAAATIPATPAPTPTDDPAAGTPPAPAPSTTYWAAPFNTDVGMMFERVPSDDVPADLPVPSLKDVVDGLRDGPPRFVGQLDRRVSTGREPFVVNVLEHALARDPQILDPATGRPSFDADRWRKALDPLRVALKAGRIVPADTETATRDIFRRRSPTLTYMRNWPVEFRRLQVDGDRDSQTLRVRVGPLPVGILGGSGLAIASNAREPGRAADFIRFLTGEEAQRILATYGLAPSRRAIYGGDYLRTLLPFIPHLDYVRRAVENARPRPVSPGYQDFSDKVGEHFETFLGGEDLPPTFADDMRATLG